MADAYDPYSVESQEIAQRRKYAEMLREQSQQPLQTQMLGNRAIPISWTQGLAQGLKGYAGAKGVAEADKQRTALAERMRTGSANDIAEALRLGQSTPARTVEPLPDEQAAGVQGFTQPAQPGNIGAGYARLAQAGPQAMQLGAPMLGSMERSQEHDEQRKWRTQEADENRTFRRDEADARRAFEKSQLEMRLQDTRLSVQERNALMERLKQMEITAAQERATQAAADRENLVRVTAGLRQPPAPITQTDAAGNTRLFDTRGNLIRDLGATGKPSGEFLKSAAAKTKLNTDLDRAIGELQKATKDGGLIDQSTGSGAGSLVDTAAGFIGKATPGAIAVGQMKPIFDLVLKMVPRFEGPQSDKDTQTYQDASGQLANPNVPNAQKKAAGKEILRLFQERRGQFIDKDVAGTEGDISAPPQRRSTDGAAGEPPPGSVRPRQ